MYSTTDFRKGLKIEIDGTPFEIIEFQHFKPGKGGAMVRTKLRNILNGRVLDNTFRSGEKVERPNLESRDMLCFSIVYISERVFVSHFGTATRSNYIPVVARP